MVLLTSYLQVLVLSVAFLCAAFLYNRSSAVNLNDFNDFDMVNFNLVYGYVDKMIQRI
jgi:hypothetical protein